MKHTLLSALFTSVLTLSSFQLLAAEGDQCLNSDVVGEGRPILLMPGFISDQSIWQEITTSLGKKYQVHQLSIAGFGKNKACSGAQDIVKNINKELTHYINGNNLNNAILIGHSMGGLIAFETSLNTNVKLAGAISVDGLPFIGPIFTRNNATTSQDLMPQATAIKAMYQQANSEQLVALTKQGLALQTNQKDRYPYIIDMAKKSDPTTAGSAIYSVMTTDLRAKLSKLNNPVLLIGASGAFETKAQHESIKTLYQSQLNNAPQVTLIMNTKGHHFLMWDETDWLIKTIEKFIGEH
jgi:pimeloyl-ACP methyl ester carboxylesterase